MLPDNLLGDEPSLGVPVNTKKTLVCSPLILAIFPVFNVCLLKPLAGLPSSSINDETDQTLQTRDEDSYFGDSLSDNEDILWADDETRQDSPVEDNAPGDSNTPSSSVATTTASVIVRALSVLVDGVEFPLTAGVRDCALVPSPSHEDDSLLVSLKSGFVLLLRLWRVPRSFSDASLALHHPLVLPVARSTLHLHLLKPFIVQWWNTAPPHHDLLNLAHSMATTSMDTSGFSLHAHPSGLAVVSTSATSVFRIHLCRPSPYGVQLSPHVNVPVDGSILHSCFCESAVHQGGDNLLMFLVMTLSPYRNVDLSLYSWYVLDSLPDNLKKTSLPLRSDFPVPLFVVPLTHSKAFLFVTPSQLILVSVHNILLADYSFTYFRYPGSFPTAFHKPLSPIKALENEDEILIASDNGVIYSVVVAAHSEIRSRPLLRIPDAISHFHLLPFADNNSYTLTFASETGNNRTLVVPELYDDDYVATLGVGETKLAYSDASVSHDYKNWAPLVDMTVIDPVENRNMCPYSTQELWMLSGTHKRTKLTNIFLGYPVKKESVTYRDVRKCGPLFYVSIGDEDFFVASFAFDTKLYANNSTDDYELVEIEEPVLLLDGPTLLAHQVSPHCVLQVTPTGVALTDFHQQKALGGITDCSITFAAYAQNTLFLVVESSGVSELRILRLLADSADADPASLASLDLHFFKSITLEFQASMMKAFFSDGFMVVFGGFDEYLRLLMLDPQLNESAHHQVNLRVEAGVPHDVLVDPLIPHDCEWSESRKELYVGSKCGAFAKFTVAAGRPVLLQTLKLGTTAVKLHLSREDDMLLFAYLRNFWLFNFYESSSPRRVAFEERSDRPVAHIAELPCSDQHRARFAFAREDGVVLGSVFCHPSVMVKQITVGEPAKKLTYLDNMEVFVMLTRSKDPGARMKFADRKSNRMVPCLEMDTKLAQPRALPIFDVNEYPRCSFIWEIQRNDRVSRKLVVGCVANETAGSIKILDLSRVSHDDSLCIKMTELISISRDEPVSCILQIDSTIFFAAERKIYSTSYSLQARKLRPVNLLITLSSDIVAMTVSDEGLLIVSTKLDSVIAFSYTEGSDTLPEGLSVQFNDPQARSLVNHVKLDQSLFIADKLHSSVYEFDGLNKLACVYKTSLIPRLLLSQGHGLWAENATDKYVMCVGVNGEITAINKIPSELREMAAVTDRLLAVRDVSEMGQLLERLDRPFAGKVTGKGFHSIYKPFFSFNKISLVDFDLDDLAGCANSGIIL